MATRSFDQNLHFVSLKIDDVESFFSGSYNEWKRVNVEERQRSLPMLFVVSRFAVFNRPDDLPVFNDKEVHRIYLNEHFVLGILHD